MCYFFDVQAHQPSAPWKPSAVIVKDDSLCKRRESRRVSSHCYKARHVLGCIQFIDDFLKSNSGALRPFPSLKEKQMIESNG